MVAFKGQSCSLAAVCVRGQRLMMPAGSRVCRLIGELLSTGRTPGHVWSLDWERRSESGGSGNSRSTCSVGMRSSTRGSAGAAPSTADVLCGNVVIHAWVCWDRPVQGCCLRSRQKQQRPATHLCVCKAPLLQGPSQRKTIVCP